MQVTTDVLTRDGKDIAFGDYSATWRFHRKVVHGALCMFGEGSASIEKIGEFHPFSFIIPFATFVKCVEHRQIVTKENSLSSLVVFNHAAGLDVFVQVSEISASKPTLSKHLSQIGNNWIRQSQFSSLCLFVYYLTCL